MGNFHWQRRYKALRAEILTERPVCEDCNARPSTRLAHIVQPSQGGSIFDKSNLLALCWPCDRDRTRKTPVLRRRPGKWSR